MSINIDFDHPVTNDAIMVWGGSGQLAILQEEAAENVTAVSRYFRGRVKKEAIAEEVADFYVSSMSVVKSLGIEDDVARFMKCKIDRLERRIKDLELEAQEKLG